MASIHDVNKQSTYSNKDINQYSESYTIALTIEGNVCSELFHPNQCLFFEQLTNGLLKQIEEQKTISRELVARFTLFEKSHNFQETRLRELEERFNASQKELKATQKEINIYTKRNKALNHEITQLKKYQFPPNLTNSDVNPSFGDYKVKMFM